MLTLLRAGARACGGHGGALLGPLERTDAVAIAPASADLPQSSSEGHGFLRVTTCSAVTGARSDLPSTGP